MKQKKNLNLLQMNGFYMKKESIITKNKIYMQITIIYMCILCKSFDKTEQIRYNTKDL